MRIMVITAVTVIFASTVLSACKQERDPPSVVVEVDPALPVGRKPAKKVVPAKPVTGTNAPRKRSMNPLTPVEGDGYQGWITPAITTEFWEPSAEQIAAMEAVMATTAADGMARAKLPDTIDLRTYVRQYRGFHRNGLDFIEVRFYCEQSRHLARGPIQIKGGGSCYLHTTFDMQARRFLDWHKNPD